MKKVIWGLLVLFFLSAPAWAQESVMRAVDAQYPHLLQQNTHATDAEFLYRAVQALGADWRLLGKSGGENGFTWPNGVRTSHDAICRVNAAEQKQQCVDVIRAAGNGVATGPSWGEIPPSDWRASNLPVKLSDVPAPGGSAPVPNPGTPVPNPGTPPPPAPVVNLQPVLDAIAVLRVQVEALQADVDSYKALLNDIARKAVDAQAAAADAVTRIDRAHQDILVVINNQKQSLRCSGRAPAFGGTITLTCEPPR